MHFVALPRMRCLPCAATSSRSCIRARTPRTRSPTNLHELAYHIRCTDGTELHITILSAIGTPGQFDRSCDGVTVVVGPATPANSPDGRRPADHSRSHLCGSRHSRARRQFSNFGALHESWQTSNSVRREDGHTLGLLQSVFPGVAAEPLYDPALTGIVGRPIDVCYEVTPAGHAARGGAARNRRATGRSPASHSTIRARYLMERTASWTSMQTSCQRGRPGGVVHRPVRQAWPHRSRSQGRFVSSLLGSIMIGVDSSLPGRASVRPGLQGPRVHAPN